MRIAAIESQKEWDAFIEKGNEELSSGTIRKQSRRKNKSMKKSEGGARNELVEYDEDIENEEGSVLLPTELDYKLLPMVHGFSYFPRVFRWRYATDEEIRGFTDIVD